MSDLIIRWWPKSGCTKSIATMDEDFARLTRELAESEARVETLQNRWASRPLSHPDGEAVIKENERLCGLLDDFIMAAELPGQHCELAQVVARSKAELGVATDQPSEGGKGQVFVWLVERPGPNGVIWATANMHWTDDATDACWFARKQDAELFQFNLGGNSTVTQHVFIYIASPPAADGAEDNSAECPRPDCVDGHIPSLPNGEPIPCPDCNRD